MTSFKLIIVSWSLTNMILLNLFMHQFSHPRFMLLYDTSNGKCLEWCILYHMKILNVVALLVKYNPTFYCRTMAWQLKMLGQSSVIRDWVVVGWNTLFLYLRHFGNSIVFPLFPGRCVTWRSLRRVDTRPCRGCATSLKMAVGWEFICACAACPYVQVLGNSWAIECNMVGTNLAQMQFYEKGIHCRTMWQRPAKCEKVNFLFSSFPDLHTEITDVAYAGLFANVASNCQTSSSHFLLYSIHSGWKASAASTWFLFNSFFSLSIWLRIVHFLPRLPAPDPVGSASASSRQVEIKTGWSWAANVLSMAGGSHETRRLSVSTFLFVYFFIRQSSIHIWSMQILDGAFSLVKFNNTIILYRYAALDIWRPRKVGVVLISTCRVQSCTQSIPEGQMVWKNVTILIKGYCSHLYTSQWHTHFLY